MPVKKIGTENFGNVSIAMLLKVVMMLLVIYIIYIFFIYNGTMFICCFDIFFKLHYMHFDLFPASIEDNLDVGVSVSR